MRLVRPTRTTSAAEHLYRLVLLRSVLLLVEVGAVLIVRFYLDVRLPWVAMLAILLGLGVLNLLTWMRVQRNVAIEEREFFLQLLLDVLALSGLLYLSGGSTNPFVSLYLLPLVIAATTLPGAYAWGMTVVTAGCYSLLFFFHHPLLPGLEAHVDHGIALHLTGMWLNFLLSAVIIAFFIARMAAAIRVRDAELALQKEEALRNERIVALGTLAAGAAHELGTPLSTMAVVLGEMKNDHADKPELAADISVLRSQVEACKSTITRMIAAAGQARAEGGGEQPVNEFLHETLEGWRLIRPGVSVVERLAGTAPAPAVLTEQTLRQAIVNLLNNAADASPDSVELEGSWDQDKLRLEIRDRGPGFSGEAEHLAGRGFFSTKPPGEGNGIGLLLAKATLERLGGQVSLRPRAGGGVCTLLELPLRALMPRDLTPREPRDLYPNAPL